MSRSVLCIGLVSAVLVASCAARQDLPKTAGDAAQCIESAVMSFVTGTPDVAGLIEHCGATIADIEKVIGDLKNQDGGASASPERAAKIAAWEDALSKYKAAHPHAK